MKLKKIKLILHHGIIWGSVVFSLTYPSTWVHSSNIFLRFLPTCLSAIGATLAISDIVKYRKSRNKNK